MQQIHLLNEKLDTLLKKYALLVAENKMLQQTIIKQTNEMDKLNHKLETLEGHLMAVEIGIAMSNDPKRETVKRQLDGVINEIDRILSAIDE